MKMAQAGARRRGFWLANRALAALICHPQNTIRIRKRFHAWLIPLPFCARAFYETVKQDICKNKADGVCAAVHDRIPEAELVAQYGFSRMTINRALRELTDEGLVRLLQGVKTFALSKGQSALQSAVSPRRLPPAVISINVVRCSRWKARAANAIRASALNVT